MTINRYLLRSTVVAALGGLLFGFDTAVIAGTTTDLSKTFKLSPASLGMTVAIALWGTVAGSFSAGIPGERYGRRDSLRILAVLYLVSALGCAFAWNWYALVAFRFIQGLGGGALLVTSQTIITESYPPEKRAVAQSIYALGIIVGPTLGPPRSAKSPPV